MRRLVLAVAAAGGALVALAGPAAAHVSVSGDGAVPGGYAVITLRVPTESDTLSTTAIAVQLPTDTPIASVAVQPHPGWSFTTRTARLASPIPTDDGPVSEAISEIDWKAESAAAAIKPGEFDQFSISAGPLPKVASLRLPTIQTYSDGSQVRWIETAAPGSSAEPDHPAPQLALSTPTAAPAAAKGPSVAGPIALSIVALVLAAAALALAVVNRARGVFLTAAAPAPDDEPGDPE